MEVLLLTSITSFSSILAVNLATIGLRSLKIRNMVLRKKKKPTPNRFLSIFYVTAATFIFSACFFMIGLLLLLPFIDEDYKTPLQLPLIVYSLLFFVFVTILNILVEKDRLFTQKRKHFREGEISHIIYMSFFQTLISCLIAATITVVLTKLFLPVSVFL